MDKLCPNCWGSLPHDDCPEVTIKSYITADLDNLLEELLDMEISKSVALRLIARWLRKQRK